MPAGIAHSTFLSWHVDDQDKALAWQAEIAACCPSCGTRADEWDPAAGGSRTAYVADVTRCSGCEVVAIAERDLRTELPDELGVRISLAPNDGDAD